MLYQVFQRLRAAFLVPQCHHSLEKVWNAWYVNFPRSSSIFHTKLCFKAGVLLEEPGWPQIFADAVVARWNSNKTAHPPANAPSSESTSSTTLEEPALVIAKAVIRNLNLIKVVDHSRQFSNIITNIQLAAAYLSIMSLVCSVFFFLLVLAVNSLY